MKRLPVIVVMLGVAAALGGCDSLHLGDFAYDLAKNACRNVSNCYAQCPDGSRTSRESPNCMGEPARRQPGPF